MSNKQRETTRQKLYDMRRIFEVESKNFSTWTDFVAEMRKRSWRFGNKQLADSLRTWPSTAMEFSRLVSRRCAVAGGPVASVPATVQTPTPDPEPTPDPDEPIPYRLTEKADDDDREWNEKIADSLSDVAWSLRQIAARLDAILGNGIVINDRRGA